ncbi:hypothetical protein D918_03766 [Trichuris suis]|nr:hypothetical protein D918_03766 [Trichuris suis]
MDERDAEFQTLSYANSSEHIENSRAKLNFTQRLLSNNQKTTKISNVSKMVTRKVLASPEHAYTNRSYTMSPSGSSYPLGYCPFLFVEPSNDSS